MKHIIIFILSIHIISAQDYQSNFIKQWQAKDTLAQLEVLEAWQQARPNDPELYTAQFNFYFNTSMVERLIMADEPSESDHLVIEDSLGNPVRYMTSEISYKEKKLTKALNVIDQGINKFPERLDMRFGKIHILGITERWKEFKTEILKSIQYSAQINNEWRWTYDEKLEEPQAIFLGTIQDYQYQLHSTMDESNLAHIEDIANEILKYYPDHMESISGLGSVYLVKGEIEKGIEKFHEALELSPNDVIVLLNLAKGHSQKASENNLGKH